MALYVNNQKVKLNLNGSTHKLIATSGGGCTLPAGIYLSASPIKNPNNCRGKRFIFNGELYATTTHYAGAGYLTQLFKWNGSAWETLLYAGDKPTIGINGCPLDSVGWEGAEYNGKFHFI